MNKKIAYLGIGLAIGSLGFVLSTEAKAPMDSTTIQAANEKEATDKCVKALVDQRATAPHSSTGHSTEVKVLQDQKDTKGNTWLCFTTAEHLKKYLEEKRS